MKHTKSRNIRVSLIEIIGYIFMCIFSALAFFAWFAASWCDKVYGSIGFDAILITLLSSLGGTAGELTGRYFRDAFMPAAAWSAIVIIALTELLLGIKRTELFGKAAPGVRALLRLLPCAAALLVCMIVGGDALSIVGADKWIKNFFSESPLYSEEYSDPKDANIVFTEKKNLVYILYGIYGNYFLFKGTGRRSGL